MARMPRKPNSKDRRHGASQAEVQGLESRCCRKPAKHRRANFPTVRAIRNIADESAYLTNRALANLSELIEHFESAVHNASAPHRAISSKLQER